MLLVFLTDANVLRLGVVTDFDYKSSIEALQPPLCQIADLSRLLPTVFENYCQYYVSSSLSCRLVRLRIS